MIDDNDVLLIICFSNYTCYTINKKVSICPLLLHEMVLCEMGHLALSFLFA